ncbi:hypothetical protein, partial [Aquimarina muelleri]|uniref:hypothetical protein n=3 Tax=Aquimarina muelleri TaxID=279356 RepID=UPI001E50CB93
NIGKIIKKWLEKIVPNLVGSPGKSSMTTYITISPAIQNYGALLVKDWNESYLPQRTDNYVPQKEEEEKKEEVKCIAWLERLETYKGEFGFDWMRDNYKDICENYEELKKEYEQITIEGETYFVPWLSMFPNQENVSLNLKVKITEGNPKNDDVIKLPSKNGIRFEPNEVKIKDIQKGEVTIKVFCDTPLSKDTKIELLNKENHRVGKITVLKNDEIRKLNVKFIKVMDNEVDSINNQRVFSQMPPNWVDETIYKFNKCYFNQALIKIKSDGLEEMIIDVDKYVEKGVLKNLVINEVRGIPRYYNGFDRELYKEYMLKNGEYRGVIFFLSAFQQPDTRQGHGQLYPTEINYMLMSPEIVGSKSLHSYAHELGHTLGLDHSWVTIEDNNKRLLQIEKELNIKREYLYKTKEYPETTPIKNSNEILKDLRLRVNKEIKLYESEKMSRTQFIPKHPFNKASTENVMDYNGYDLSDGTEIRNPNQEGFTFWKWQWQIMRNEVKSYYGE